VSGAGHIVVSMSIPHASAARTGYLSPPRSRTPSPGVLAAQITEIVMMPVRSRVTLTFVKTLSCNLQLQPAETQDTNEALCRGTDSTLVL